MFNKILYNTSINFIAKIIATGLGLAAVAIMTRYLGRIGFGQYTTIIAYLQFFGLLADMGLTLVTGQMLAKYPDKENKIINNLFTFRLIAALIFLVPAPIIVLFLPYSLAVKTGIFIAVISFLFIALNQILIGFYQKHLMMMRASAGEVGGRLALVLAVVIAVYYDSGLRGIVIATTIASIFNFLINYFLIPSFIKLRLAYDKNMWREIFSLSWPIALTIAFNIIYLKTDTLILSLIKSEAEVGLYGAAYRVIDVLIMLPFVLAGLMLPQLTAAKKQGQDGEFKKIIQNSFDLMFIIALPMVIGAQFIASPLMSLVAGNEFFASGKILQLLIFAAGIIYLGTIFSHVLIAIEKQKKAIWAYMLTAITTLIGYLIFIPRYSYFGAAAVTIYSEVLIAVLIFSITFYYIKFIPNLTIAVKSVIACLFMGLGLYYSNLSLIPTLLISAVIYSAIFYSLARNNLREMIR
ncbi:MAG: flippase [Patescibacteria group bacterium]|jgi:O-antigen/teichoic acid export membrane protein